MASYFQGEVMGAFRFPDAVIAASVSPSSIRVAARPPLPGSSSWGMRMRKVVPGRLSPMSLKLQKAAALQASSLRMKRMINRPDAAMQQAVMAAAFHGDDFLGGKAGDFLAKFDITSKKRRIAMKKDIANLDPTSKTAAYGKYVQVGIAAGAAAAGTLIGLPPQATFGVITTGLQLGGAARKQQMNATKAAKAASAAKQQVIIDAAGNPTPASPEVGPGGQEQKKSFVGPLIGIGAAVVAALTMM